MCGNTPTHKDLHEFLYLLHRDADFFCGDKKRSDLPCEDVPFTDERIRPPPVSAAPHPGTGGSHRRPPRKTMTNYDKPRFAHKKHANVSYRTVATAQIRNFAQTKLQEHTPALARRIRSPRGNACNGPSKHFPRPSRKKKSQR